MAETDCGQEHFAIEEAIRHARHNLDCLDTEPIWGTKKGAIANFGNVIGYQTTDGKKRWRLDYDPVKGAHVNEEDFTCKPPSKVVHKIKHAIVKDQWVILYWQKWTRRYDKPDWLIERDRK
jgi:hypothetical protein